MADTDTVKERQIRIVVDSSSARQGVGEITRALSDIDDKLAKLGESVTGGFSKLGKGLLALISWDVIKTNVNSLISAFDQLGSRASTLGVSTNWLQGFEAAAASTSVKIADANGALDKFAKLVGEAQLGTKSAVDTLAALNVKIFDANRQVRPLNDLFQEAAGSLDKLNGTALGSALGIQTMGKEYQRIAPMMGAVAQGAEAAGASFAKIVSPEKLAIWGELATNADKTMLKWRGFAGENFAGPVKAGFELIKGAGESALKMFDGVWKTLEGVSKAFTGSGIAENMTRIFSGVQAIVDGAVSSVSALIQGLATLANMGSNSDTRATISRDNAESIAGINKELDAMRPGVMARWETIQRLQEIEAKYGKEEPKQVKKRVFGTQTEPGLLEREMKTYGPMVARYNYLYARRDAFANSQLKLLPGAGEPPPVTSGEFLSIDQEIGQWSQYKASAKGGGTTGVYGATATGGGGGANDGDRIAKRIRELEAEADAQEKMAAKAYEGAGAIAAQEASWKAVQQAMEAYGGKVDATDPKVVKLAGTFANLNKTSADDKVLTSFRLQTVDIERSNDLLQRRLELVGESPEIVAREVAIIQVRNEALKDGVTRSQEDIDRRGKAAEQQEILNQKIVQSQQAQQLWLEPVKEALRDIQSFGSDMWSKILDGGQLTFQSIGDMAKQMVKKVAAEFLSLATIRPVIGITVAAMNSAGIMPTSYAQQMGYGSYLSGAGGSSGVGGMGGMGLLGGGMGGWLSSPISFGGALNTSAASPASMMAPTGATGASLGGMTWGQGLAGIGSIGMGAYQLLSGGGSPSSIIGGAAGILGGGLGIAGALMPAVLGGALGPIGMGIGLLGGILPGLLGGGTPPVITNSTFAQLQYGTGGWGTSGGAWGPSANSSATEAGLKSLGGSISNVFGLLGGVKNPGSVWGATLESRSVSGQGWQSDSTSSYLVDPSGNKELWRMNESNMSDTLSAQIAYRSILEGATGEISENMRKAVTQTGQTMGGTSLQSIAETITEVLAFDKAIGALGKTVTTAEQAIAQIDDSFSALYGTADKYGFATTGVDVAKQKARLDYAMDFGKGISRGILEMTDPQAAALADLDDWKRGLVDNNKWLLENVTGALDQINEIERLYGLKRAAIVEQGTQQSLNTLEDAIKRLTMGDLAGLSPTDALSGAKATYDALAAKANASPGDAALANKLGAAGVDYAGIAQSYYAGSPAYEAIRQQIVVQLAKAGVNAGGDATANNLGDLTQVLAVLGQQVANLTVQLTTATNDNTEIKARLAEVTALYLRLAGNQ